MLMLSDFFFLKCLYLSVLMLKPNSDLLIAVKKDRLIEQREHCYSMSVNAALSLFKDGVLINLEQKRD